MRGKGRRWRVKKRVATSCGCSRSVGLGSDAKIVGLKKWMKRSGFNECHLEPATFVDTGRGLRATQKFEKGATVISIPKKLLITTDTVFTSALGPFIKRSKLMLTPAEAISIFLIWELSKGTSSFWFPYISSLPTSYSNAAYWTGEEIVFLPELVREKIRNQIQKAHLVFSNLQSFCETVRHEFPKLQPAVTWESVRWAWSTINTRSVYMKQAPNPHLSQQEEDHYALAPYLDLLNHTDSAEISASFNQERQHYEIKTLTPCSRFNQVFINYGPHDNHKLLTEYGFILPRNQHNAIKFHLDDMQDIASYFQVIHTKERFAIIVDNNLHKSLSCSREGASWSVLTVLRILCLNFVELKKWKMVLSGQPLSESVETKVKQMLRHLLSVECNKLPNIEMVEYLNSDHIRMAVALCEEHQQIIAENQRLLLD